MLSSTVEMLDNRQITYLQDRMEEVSRSFALVVPMLEAPFNHYMATAYLLCRVVDNIEDCTQPLEWRQQRFEEFLALLHYPENAASVVAQWEAETWPGLTPAEARLMTVASGLPLWQIYAGIPAAARATMREWTEAMALGMRDIDEPHQSPCLIERNGIQVLETEHDYNHYCYIVAGTVGHMATELAAQHYAFAGSETETLIAQCEACGRALQKTNIVKDFAVDLARGVSFLPQEWMIQADYTPLSLQGASVSWKKMVVADVLDELRAGTDYAVTLPYDAKGYRMASLLCLLPAYETILLAARNQKVLFTPKHQVKISRMKMAQCKRRAKSMLGDNDAIRRYSQEMEQSVLAAFNTP